MPNGDRLEYGAQGEVTGPSVSETGKRVNVQFPFGLVDCFVVLLCSTRPMSACNAPLAAPAADGPLTGQRVHVSGLSARVDLNGQVAVAGRLGGGRYTVKFEGSGEAVRVRPANLSAASAAGTVNAAAEASSAEAARRALRQVAEAALHDATEVAGASGASKVEVDALRATIGEHGSTAASSEALQQAKQLHHVVSERLRREAKVLKSGSDRRV